MLMETVAVGFVRSPEEVRIVVDEEVFFWFGRGRDVRI
jgi:hypothetical protein